MEKKGLVEKVELIGAVNPRVLWRLKEGRPQPGPATPRHTVTRVTQQPGVTAVHPTRQATAAAIQHDG